MDPKTQALIWRFLLGLAITELPVISYQLAQPVFDWRALSIGLIGGLAAALEKWFAPQLADTLVAPASNHVHPISVAAPSPLVITAGSIPSVVAGSAVAPSPPSTDPTVTPGQP